MFTQLKKYFFLFVIMSLFTLSVKGDAKSDFVKANELYQKLDFDNSIKSYENLIKLGNVSAEVYYNLGNCYYKTGNLPLTMLNYERAKKLSPDDEDINFNIKVASLKVVDKMETVPEIFYKRWLKDVALTFTADAWTKIFLGCVWMLFAFLAVYVVTQSASLKKMSLAIVLFFLISTITVFLISQKSYAMTFVDQQAIIKTASVYVKSSPDERGSDQFIIHEGTKVDVLDELGEWKKIRIANGSIGWLKENEIAII